MLSARLDRYYGHLRRPPGWLPLPGSSPVIGRPAPTALRSLPGRGGPLQFPPPLSERSEPLTPGSPSRLHFQDLHRFHGLRPSLPGSALPRPTPKRAGRLTTRQASLDVTDRSVAHPAKRDARRWASTPPVSRRHRQPATGPPDSYPDRTYTGKRRRACESDINHLHDQPPTLWTHQGLPVSDRGHRARGVAVSPFRAEPARRRGPDARPRRRGHLRDDPVLVCQVRAGLRRPGYVVGDPVPATNGTSTRCS